MIQSKASPLIAIVTGLEHSGTTYLSSFITRHPLVSSSFECGVLLADSPKDFTNIHPFYDWMMGNADPETGTMDLAASWKIKEQDMDKICLSDNWNDMYSKIIQYSPIFNNKSCLLLDKCPMYMPDLDRVLEKVTAPCLVIEKDICYQYLSYKKRDFSLDYFKDHYTNYMIGLSKSLKKFGNRIYRISFEDLISNPSSHMEDILDFIGLDYPDNLFSLPYMPQSPIRKSFSYRREVKKINSLTKSETSDLKALEKLF